MRAFPRLRVTVRWCGRVGTVDCTSWCASWGKEVDGCVLGDAAGAGYVVFVTMWTAFSSVKDMRMNARQCLFLTISACFCSSVPALGVFSEEEKLQMRKSFEEPSDRLQKFLTAEQYHPARTIHASREVHRLGPHPLEDSFAPTYSFDGMTYTLNTFHERNYTTAFLVLKDGKIVCEQYLHGSSENTRFLSFSVGKSITSILLGMAIDDGCVKSVHDPLTQYLPSLMGSAYEGVTIKDALQMLSGVSWDDSVDFVRVRHDTMIMHRYRFAEAANSLHRGWPVGTKWNYNGMDTALLGWVLENATKKRLTNYMEERMWQPAGMESDAKCLLDGPPEIGREFCMGDFAITLRDYGRFGLLLLNGGHANGKQLLSKEWVRKATTPDRTPIQCGNLEPGYPLGYGYQWWLFPSGRFQAAGAYGQVIYIAPDADVVIVKLSHWPELYKEELEKEYVVFFDAIIKYLE